MNLLAGSSDPAFGFANFSPGNYDNVEFKLSPVLPGGKTILIRFIHAQTQFELSTTREFELEVEGLSGLDLTDAGRAVNLLVLLDLDRLFAGITFDALVPDNDGVVRINDDANSGLLESILNNLDDACEAGEDRDKDGEIDKD